MNGLDVRDGAVALGVMYCIVLAREYIQGELNPAAACVGVALLGVSVMVAIREGKKFRQTQP